MSSRVNVGKIKGLIRSDRPIMQMSFRSTIRSMVTNIKETFPPKPGMWKRQVLQDPAYVKTVDTFCMRHATMQGAILIAFTVHVNTVNTYNWITM